MASGLVKWVVAWLGIGVVVAPIALVALNGKAGPVYLPCGEVGRSMKVWVVARGCTLDMRESASVSLFGMTSPLEAEDAYVPLTDAASGPERKPGGILHASGPRLVELAEHGPVDVNLVLSSPDSDNDKVTVGDRRDMWVYNEGRFPIGALLFGIFCASSPGWGFGLLILAMQRLDQRMNGTKAATPPVTP